tara:strand:- start:288 stop:1361 length:1074 start_codon:yes stop_codon:yes gene_type:complete
MSSVELKSIVKKYGAVTAVASIDLSVESGEFVTLLGPSGCGKTTTLRMVAGFIRPTSGTLSIGDVDMTGVPPHKRTVGLVFQNYALFPHMSVRKNVEFGLKMQKVLTSERAPRVQEALELVQLEALGERMPSELSGGQQQRVALARALVIRPDVLLLDEPFGALDKQLRDHMRVELRELQQKLKISTLFVTHDQDEALSMSDRIVVMSDGKVSQIGSPTDIYEKPKSRFVADFIGRSNILSAKVDDNGKVINAEGLKLPNKQEKTQKTENFSVMIRPECVAISKSGSKESGRTTNIKGKITSTIYLGSIIQYDVQIDQGPSIVVTQNNTGLENFKALVIGDEVDVLFPDAATYVLPN